MVESASPLNRRNAILVGSLVAVVAAAELVALSALLASERRDDRRRYADAITEQRRAAGRASRPTDANFGRSSVRTTLCVRGVHTIATTVENALHRDLITPDKRVDIAQFRELSNRAVRAERYVEQASAGPALLQRMGRTRVADNTWQPIDPPRIECEDGDAFARFRLDVMTSESQPKSKP